jgi:tyrosyl-tRNA synthetase
MRMASFVDELAWRGLVHQKTDEQLGELMQKEPFTLYCGFDPTSSSLHLGNLLQILALMRAQRAGHRPIALVGGATGMVGDPSGKTAERKLQDRAVVAANVENIRGQLARFLDFSPGKALLVDNFDWMRDFGYLDFLARVGKMMSVNMMLSKESVRARLEDREHGISYTEFSYMLLQAYDFQWLWEHHGCKMQVGGSDQWGNITCGIDLIRRVHGQQAFGLTQPLVTDSAGNKFGKSEKGAFYLDAEKTSPYELWQFLVQSGDADVRRYLRYFTSLDEKTIAELDREVETAPEKREAQRVLAREVLTLVHGGDEATKAERAASALFGEGLSSLDAAAIEQVFKDAPSSTEPLTVLDGAGTPLVELLVRAQVCAGKGAARRDIEGGGIYVNDRRVDDVARAVTRADLLAGRFVVLRKGKKSYHLVRFA